LSNAVRSNSSDNPIFRLVGILEVSGHNVNLQIRITNIQVLGKNLAMSLSESSYYFSTSHDKFLPPSHLGGKSGDGFGSFEGQKQEPRSKCLRSQFAPHNLWGSVVVACVLLIVLRLLLEEQSGYRTESVS